MNLLTKKQFEYVCKMLQAQGKPLTKESITMYLRQNKNQLRKFAEDADNRYRNWELSQRAYLQNILFRFKLFGRYFIMYRWGVRGRGFSFEIIKSERYLDDKNK